MPAPALATPLCQELRERIRAHGPLTFAEYMEACLYHPEFGYYTRPEQERLRDYFTSVDVHPVFGRLLARQFFEMWGELSRPNPFCLVEAGAGAGTLAKHILDFIAEFSAAFYQALRYITVERSGVFCGKQQAVLERHLRADRVAIRADFPDTIPVGCVFSNELLDALPVHRIVQAGSELREVFVGARGEELCDQCRPLSTPAIRDYLSRQNVELAGGQQAEAGLAACAWMENAGRRLGRGFVLTIDYGHEAAELYSERRMRGTLVAYHRHQVSEDYYGAPGEQDLTAHVSFTALDLAGRRAGLERVALTSQSHFFLALARASEFTDIELAGAGEREKASARLHFKNLIHPEGMGETFRVLIQHKGVPGAHLSGLEPL